MYAGFGLNIHTLSRSVLDGNMMVVGDVEPLSRSVVVTGGDGDASTIGRVASEVDAEYLIAGSIEHLDFGSAKVVVEQLGVPGTA